MNVQRTRFPFLFALLALLPVMPAAAQPGVAVEPVVTPELRDVVPIEFPSEIKHLIENVTEPPGLPPLVGPPAPDAAWQSQPGLSAPLPAPIGGTAVNFDGISVGNSAPPDTEGHVGPNHFVQFVNSRFAIWDKSGNLLYGPAQGKTLWQFLGGACAVHNDGDPITVYDQLADRWVLTQFTVPLAAGDPAGEGSHECVAISRTGDPLGAYYLYDFLTSDSQEIFHDYPHIGVWPDGYYMTTHNFGAFSSGGSFSSLDLFVFDRAAMIQGKAAKFATTAVVSGGGYGGLPAGLDGFTLPPAGSPAYLFTADTTQLSVNTAPKLHQFRATVTWGANPSVAITGPVNLTPTSYTDQFSCVGGTVRGCVPQPPPANADQDYLDVLTGHLMFRIAYRNFGDHESVVMNQTVNNNGFAGVRWYELRRDPTSLTNNYSIFQQGTYAPIGPLWRWMGSIAQDNAGNIAIGYSISDAATTFPGVAVTGRLAGDALGTMGAEAVVHAGGGVQTGTGNRWGDYSEITVDPRDGCTFWLTNEYIPAQGSFNWKTRIAAYRFPLGNCAAPPQGILQGTITNCTSGAPIGDAVVTLSNGFSGATDAQGHYSIVSAPRAATATPSAPYHLCVNGQPASVTITNGGTATQNFCLDGSPKYELVSATVSDAGGNGNGILNLGECDNIDVRIKNVGCHDATGINSTLSSPTPNLSLTSTNSSYPTIPIGGSATETLPFKAQLSPTFVCGNPIDMNVALTDNAFGAAAFSFTLPSCGAAAAQPPLVTAELGPTSSVQVSRLGRDGNPSGCLGAKSCPGPLSTAAGNRFYNAHQFHTPPGTGPVCVTFHIDANCGAGNEIFSAAYQGLAANYDNQNLCSNASTTYLADIGYSGFGDTVRSGDYATVVPADTDYFVVMSTITNVNTTCTNVPPGSGPLGYKLQVGGYYNTGTVTSLPTLTCPQTPVACVPAGAASGNVSYAPPLVSGVCGASPTPACAPPSGSSFAVGSTQVNCSVTVNSQTANCSFNEVVANNPVGTISAAGQLAPNSAGNAASVANAGVGATYLWTITGGTLTGGQGTPTIAFSAGSSGSVLLQVQIQTAVGCGNTGSLSIPIGNALTFYTLSPCRVYDSRLSDGALASGVARTITISGGSCGIPATAQAVSFNFTAIAPTAAGSVSFYPDAGTPPVPGTIHFRSGAGVARANNAVMALAAGGSTVQTRPNMSGGGSVQLVVDINGYFQ